MYFLSDLAIEGTNTVGVILWDDCGIYSGSLTLRSERAVVYLCSTSLAHVLQ